MYWCLIPALIRKKGNCVIGEPEWIVFHLISCCVYRQRLTLTTWSRNYVVWIIPSGTDVMTDLSGALLALLLLAFKCDIPDKKHMVKNVYIHKALQNFVHMYNNITLGFCGSPLADNQYRYSKFIPRPKWVWHACISTEITVEGCLLRRPNDAYMWR